MKSVAYFTNTYPMPSQSFIRREIAAIERRGVPVARFAARLGHGPHVDPADQAELAKTRAVLDVGAVGLGLALLGAAFRRPSRLLAAVRQARRLGRASGRGLPIHLVYLAEACVLRRWLADGRIDHLHAHFGTNSATVAMLCRTLGGPPYSVTVHGPEEFDDPVGLALGEKVRHSAFTVAISEFGRSQLCRWADVADWPKLKTVRCGVDSIFLGRPITAPTDPTGLVCVGRLAEQKGQLVLIEAAGRLLAEGADFSVVLVGDGPMRAEIEAAIRRLGLGGRVRLAGWLSNDEVRCAMEAARLFVLPSFAEGLPVVLMEALALGRPVVTTYVAGIPELVEPGACGWLVPPGSVDALVGALREALAAEPGRLAAMGRDGAARVARRHDVDAEAGALLALIEGEPGPAAGR